jgi:hypothetical protein
MSDTHTAFSSSYYDVIIVPVRTVHRPLNRGVNLSEQHPPVDPEEPYVPFVERRRRRLIRIYWLSIAGFVGLIVGAIVDIDSLFTLGLLTLIGAAILSNFIDYDEVSL